MLRAISRAAVLRGRWVEDPAPPRPPWAAPAFETACERCDRCLEACPEAIVRLGAGGFPEVDFGAGGCTFCGACADVCPTEALDRRRGAPWRLKARIGSDCIARQGVVCRLCEEQCEARTIRFRPAPRGRAQPTLNAALCTGCGACVGVCPSDAITIGEEMP